MDPLACLAVDGESSLASDEVGVMLSRQGCARMFRALSQRAELVERRRAFLRDQLHKVDTQLSAEDVPF
eukprot:2660550-Lingulodinium_polyedra.AAC.1